MDEMAERSRSRAILALGVVVAAFAVGPGAQWVGSDRWMLGANAALGDVWAALSTAQLSPAGEPALAEYRPLTMLTRAPIAWLGAGVMGERWLGLGVHLAAMALLVRLARKIGANGPAAWLGAAIFGLHPAVTETVCWPGARGAELATVLLLAGWTLLIEEKELPAGLLLAITPFFCETFLLVPITALAWMWARGKLARRTLLLCWAGSGAYLAARYGVGLERIHWGTPVDVLTNLGGIAVRGTLLLVDPTAPDAVPLHQPSLFAGAMLFAAGLSLFWVQRGRLWLVPAVAPMVLLLPWAPVAGAAGVLNDEAVYPLVAGVAMVVAVGVSKLGESRWTQLAWALPIALAIPTFRRAQVWGDEGLVYASSYARDASNPHAAYLLADHLRRVKGDCDTAVPLYRQAVAVEPLANEGLRACGAE